MSDTPRTDAVANNRCLEGIMDRYKAMRALAAEMERELASARVVGIPPWSEASYVDKLERLLRSCLEEMTPCTPGENCALVRRIEETLATPSNGLSPQEKMAADTGPLTVAALVAADSYKFGCPRNAQGCDTPEACGAEGRCARMKADYAPVVQCQRPECVDNAKMRAVWADQATRNADRMVTLRGQRDRLFAFLWELEREALSNRPVSIAKSAWGRIHDFVRTFPAPPSGLPPKRQIPALPDAAQRAEAVVTARKRGEEDQ